MAEALLHTEPEEQVTHVGSVHPAAALLGLKQQLVEEREVSLGPRCSLCYHRADKVVSAHRSTKDGVTSCNRGAVAAQNTGAALSVGVARVSKGVDNGAKGDGEGGP